MLYWIRKTRLVPSPNGETLSFFILSYLEINSDSIKRENKVVTAYRKV